MDNTSKGVRNKMSNKDLSLSVFTKENYKNLNHTATNFRNSMYDELEVNKGRFKNCNFDEGIFKNINAISNSKVVNSSMNDCIFEQVNFYKNLFKKFLLKIQLLMKRRSIIRHSKMLYSMEILLVKLKSQTLYLKMLFLKRQKLAIQHLKISN